MHTEIGCPASYRDACIRRDAWVRRSTVLLLAALLAAPALAAQDFSHPDSEPAPEAALIQQANDALAASDFAAALKILTGLNTQTPNNPQVLYDLGLTLEALRPETPNSAAPDSKALTAESCYRQSIAANPLFPAAHVALGLLLARTARPVEARSELLTATQLPDTAPALKARALRALARLDLIGNAQQASNPTAASAELLAALNLTPEAPEDIVLAAEIAESAVDLPAAERAYRRYLALPGNSADPEAIAALAHVLLAERRPADAEALLAPALAAHPSDPALTALVARADISSDDPAKVAQAAPLLEKLHAANPQDANITRLLARVYLDTNHPDQADPLYAALISTQSHAGKIPTPRCSTTAPRRCSTCTAPAPPRRCSNRPSPTPQPSPTPPRWATPPLISHSPPQGSTTHGPTLQALALRATVLPPSPSTLFLEAMANDTLHRNARAIDLYRQFLAAAGTDYPDQAAQARQRLAALAPGSNHAPCPR